MKKHKAALEERAKSTVKRAEGAAPSREYIHSLRGTFRGRGLLKALMAEKKREREL